jgi:hypothetical protein
MKKVKFSLLVLTGAIALLPTVAVRMLAVIPVMRDPWYILPSTTALSTLPITRLSGSQDGVLVPLRRYSNYGVRLRTSYNLIPFKTESIKNLDSRNVQTGLVIPLK